MIALYNAIVKKINHEHDFKLINKADYHGPNARDGMPSHVIHTYMCKCGKVKKVIAGDV